MPRLQDRGPDLDRPLDDRDAMSWRHAETSCLMGEERAKKVLGLRAGGN